MKTTTDKMTTDKMIKRAFSELIQDLWSAIESGTLDEEFFKLGERVRLHKMSRPQYLSELKKLLLTTSNCKGETL